MSSNPFTLFPSIYPPHEGPANYHHRPSLTGHGAVNKVLLEHSRIYSPTYCYGCFHTTMVNVVEKPHGLKYSLSGPFRKSLLIPILCPNSNPILLAFCFKFSNESLHQILLAPSPKAFHILHSCWRTTTLSGYLLSPYTKKVASPQLQKEK